MKRLVLLLTLFMTPLAVSYAQEPGVREGVRIGEVAISGIERERLDSELRADIEALVDTPFSQERVDALTRRIEAEHTELIAASRSQTELPDGAVRIVFLVADIDDDEALESNINARYIVESVEVSGIADSEISQPLRDDLQALVGERLDPDEADALESRLSEELTGYEVRRSVERGDAEGQVRVLFEVERTAWIPFVPSRSKLVYHSKHVFSGVLDWGFGPGDHRFTIGGVFSNDDDLIERYQGYRLRYQNRRAGTERLGFSLEFSSLRESWRSETLLALESAPEIPEPYRDRQTLEPSITFAFSPEFRVSVGASLSELESLSQSPTSETANAAVASLSFGRRWEMQSGSTQQVDATYQVRSGTRSLESDVVYTRHSGQMRYTFQNGKNTVVSVFSAGRVTGRPPLFERFSIGDSTTLRGWNKYDITPAGAENVVHHSLEYRYGEDTFGMVFFDVGSAWDSGMDRKVRLSTGLGFGSDGFSLLLGFPLSSSGVSPMFMARIEF